MQGGNEIKIMIRSTIKRGTQKCEMHLTGPKAKLLLSPPLFSSYLSIQT
jgi:hypothetical protein